MPAEGKFSIEDGSRQINFFLKPVSDSSSDLFWGNKKIGAFRRLNIGTWKAKFGACGEMWTGMGEAPDLLEAVGKFVYLSEERRKLPDVLDDDYFKPWHPGWFSTSSKGLDSDLAIEQVKRDHLRKVKFLDNEITKLSPRFVRA